LSRAIEVRPSDSQRRVIAREPLLIGDDPAIESLGHFFNMAARRRCRWLHPRRPRSRIGEHGVEQLMRKYGRRRVIGLQAMRKRNTPMQGRFTSKRPRAYRERPPEIRHRPRARATTQCRRRAADAREIAMKNAASGMVSWLKGGRRDHSGQRWTGAHTRVHLSAMIWGKSCYRCSAVRSPFSARHDKSWRLVTCRAISADQAQNRTPAPIKPGVTE